MSRQTETRTYTITSRSTELLDRIEALLCMIDHNSRTGHSGIFGMSLDGDGEDKVAVSGGRNLDRYRKMAGKIGDVGYDVEYVSSSGMTAGVFKNHDANHAWAYDAAGERA